MHSIVEAANTLDTSEYEILRRGYIDWHGTPPAPEVLQQAFRDYFQHHDAPLWAQHYARKIVFEFQRQESVRVTTTRLLATLLTRSMTADAALPARRLSGAGADTPPPHC